IKQRTEEAGEEHDFREDEPEHPHAERLVDLLVELVRLVLGDDVGKPAGKHEYDDSDSRPHDPETGLGTVKPVGHAYHQHEQADRTDDRPVTAVGDVVSIFSVRHLEYRGSG